MPDERGDVSCSDSIRAEDGRIYSACDQERYGDREILMAVFTEKYILAGRILNEKSRLKIIVSKATGRPSVRCQPIITPK